MNIHLLMVLFLDEVLIERVQGKENKIKNRINFIFIKIIYSWY